jgi:hypothetical protein
VSTGRGFEEREKIAGGKHPARQTGMLTSRGRGTDKQPKGKNISCQNVTVFITK